ncbi:MAG: prolyl oligopeptidase family serine peptidase [Acidobacteriia bacterium]|nr:prolyl oligopeptidase family serine peptidase [Terriglobia bacterium]
MRWPFPILVVAFAALAAAEKHDELIALYDYDGTLPLDVHTKEISSREGYRIAEVSFALPKTGTMSGFLVTPLVKGKKPGIIWMHSSGAIGFLGNAVLMGKAGAVSILVGEADGLPGGTAEQARDQLIADVVGLRRAIDVLSSRDDVDPSRIAIVGHSSGAMMAAVAASIDKRFTAAVYEVGLLGMSVHIATSPGAWAQGVRKQLGEHLAHFLEITSVVDDANYIGQAPGIPKLFQSAWYDPGVPRKDAEDFFNASSAPKELKWYDTGHDIDDPQAVIDRIQFLSKALRLRNGNAVLKKLATR